MNKIVYEPLYFIYIPFNLRNEYVKHIKNKEKIYYKNLLKTQKILEIHNTKKLVDYITEINNKM